MTYCCDSCADEPEEPEDGKPKEFVPYFGKISVLIAAVNHVYSVVVVLHISHVGQQRYRATCALNNTHER